MDYQERIRRSVDSLDRVYSVVVALAITIAIQTLLFDKGVLRPFFDDNGSFTLLKNLSDFFPALIAFVATAVPFYQGMGRHLDQIYVERPVDPSKQGFLLLDFIVFFVESCLLVALAALVTTQDYSFLVLVALLVFDSLWGLTAHGIHYGEVKPSTLRWSLINLVAVIVLLMFYFSALFSGAPRLWALSLTAVIRTAADYSLCWRFYFPAKAEEGGN